jgi:hypothetical protein
VAAIDAPIEPIELKAQALRRRWEGKVSVAARRRVRRWPNSSGGHLMRRTIVVALLSAGLALASTATQAWASTRSGPVRPTGAAGSLTPMRIVPPPGYRWVGKIIKKDFLDPLGRKNYQMAMCVAQRESNFDPKAYNPKSGASGVFQFIPTSWDYYSKQAGYGGKSPFNAYANVGTAAWVVKHVGWGPWGGHCP